MQYYPSIESISRFYEGKSHKAPLLDSETCSKGVRGVDGAGGDVGRMAIIHRPMAPAWYSA